ncbi:MAG: tRNA (5-methylaminomethyl-2-thiouridine)(34)-methyltransferase MnmD [Saprospiraceae bacterium]
MSDPQIFITADGSHSLVSDQFAETYHSRHGAIQESRHVFIKEGLHRCQLDKEIHILELGFGTGLNALLTLVESIANDISIRYSTYELYPVPISTAFTLNYVEQMGLDSNTFQPLFEQMHNCAWSEWIAINPNFRFEKIQADIKSLNVEDEYSLVYFDAFAPSTQPELWQEALLKSVFRSMKSGGILSTYCAQGAFKRTLRSVGFEVEELDGPPGKRQMTLAIKP